jgi:hypothetical protein
MGDNNIIIENWDKKAKYTYGFGISYYFTGKRQIVKDGKTIIKECDSRKQINVFEELLQFMADTSDKYGGNHPFLVIDDCSPVKPIPDRVLEILGNRPVVYLRLPVNIGAGGKENIIQKVLSERCKYVLRFDSDIKLDNLSLPSIKKAFEELKDAWAITSCITYFARVYAATLLPEQRYFHGSNIADFVAMRSSVFKKVGYADPKLRKNMDGEMRLRLLSSLDMKCYTDREIKGKAIPSGTGGNLKINNECARYVEMTRPFIRVSYPKNCNARFMLNKKKKDLGKGFYVPALPFAEKLCKAIWE